MNTQTTESDLVDRDASEFPEQVQVLGKFVCLDNLNFEKGELWEVLSEDCGHMKKGLVV